MGLGIEVLGLFYLARFMDQNVQGFVGAMRTMLEERYEGSFRGVMLDALRHLVDTFVGLHKNATRDSLGMHTGRRRAALPSGSSHTTSPHRCGQHGSAIPAQREFTESMSHKREAFTDVQRSWRFRAEFSRLHGTVETGSWSSGNT